MHESTQAAKAASGSDRRERPYQVLIFAGGAGEQPPVVEGVRVADLTVTPAELSTPNAAAAGTDGTADGAATAVGAEHPLIARLRDSGLTPADLRSRSLFMVSPDTSPAVAVAAYATVVGFAGRRLDAACGDAKVDAAVLDARTRAVADVERPAVPCEHVQVGAEHAEIPSVGANGQLSPSDVAQLRFARRARMVPPADALSAVAQFVVVAALRARGETDRFPLLVDGTEPAPGDDDGAVGVDLDQLRRAAVELRRTMRFEDRSSLAEKAEPTTRQQTLCAAAALPVEAVMVALGATTPDGSLWHCPRPERHRNGDANASMRLEKGKARCFRCDPEKVDSLRLTADTKRCSFDEAADWLLAEVAPKLDSFLASAAEMTAAAADDSGMPAAPAA